jgi:hypothetical protein
MNIDPADPTPVQIAHFDEGYNIAVRDRRSLEQLVVIVEQLVSTAADIADQQLAMDQIVSRSLTHPEEPFELADEGLAAHEEPDPNRRVHQDH